MTFNFSSLLLLMNCCRFQALDFTSMAGEKAGDWLVKDDERVGRACPHNYDARPNEF